MNVYAQKSRIFRQKSPTYLQKSCVSKPRTLVRKYRALFRNRPRMEKSQSSCPQKAWRGQWLKDMVESLNVMSRTGHTRRHVTNGAYTTWAMTQRYVWVMECVRSHERGIHDWMSRTGHTRRVIRYVSQKGARRNCNLVAQTRWRNRNLVAHRRVVRYVSKNQNESNDKNQWYNIYSIL